MNTVHNGLRRHLLALALGALLAAGATLAYPAAAEPQPTPVAEPLSR
ncbi:hypothetical protein [Crossiella cryophila]|uniref:Uncharacterized protein n=1 Tax=Crossiella cryophila TaxID=43355 RepID=A0A7W7FRP5_9PSEU|nr:hypothetical protein [Crossiella cryophila]MBB4675352.1 hypothetical protein [Crossiella cryophila]